VIIPLLLAGLLAADTPVARFPVSDTPGALAAQEIARVEADYRAAGRSQPLVERLLLAARKALDEGRFADAAAIAGRAELSLARGAVDKPRQTTAPAGPTIEILLDALARLRAAEVLRPRDPIVGMARELVDAAEKALNDGNIAQAEELAGRAIVMLSSLAPDAAAPADTRPALDINTATARELATIPGMTPEMITNLIWFRASVGRFNRPEELRYVPGFTLEYVLLQRQYLDVRR